MTASGFIRALRSHQDPLTARDEPLGVIGRRAAHHADRQGLGDVLRNREQLRHRLERLAEVILVQAGDDDALALIGERRADGWQLDIEELPLVDSDDLRFGPYSLEQLARAG